MREELGAPAGQAARGAMAAQELRQLAQRQAAMARRSPDRPLRRSPRGADPRPDESPRSQAARRRAGGARKSEAQRRRQARRARWTSTIRRRRRTVPMRASAPPLTGE
eukprot:5895386-Pleurochrysis_carterae.AAC.1